MISDSGAFYTGAADQVMRAYREGGTQYVELAAGPVGTEGRPVPVASAPSSVASRND